MIRVTSPQGWPPAWLRVAGLAGVWVFFQHRWMQIPGSSIKSSLPSHHLADWPGNSQARICLFCFRILVFQKSPSFITHLSNCGSMLAGCFSLPTPPLRPPSPPPPTLRGNQEKQDSTCPSPWRLLGIAGIVTISGSNRTIYRIVNTNCSVEW